MLLNYYITLVLALLCCQWWFAMLILKRWLIWLFAAVQSRSLMCVTNSRYRNWWQHITVHLGSVYVLYKTVHNIFVWNLIAFVCYLHPLAAVQFKTLWRWWTHQKIYFGSYFSIGGWSGEELQEPLGLVCASSTWSERSQGKEGCCEESSVRGRPDKTWYWCRYNSCWWWIQEASCSTVQQVMILISFLF